MTIVAVAGGSSPTLGRSIVDAIAKTSNKPVILSRQKDSEKDQTSSCHGADVRYVDYTSHDSLVHALTDVETVISVIKIPGSEWMTYQINLLNAAKAAGVKRFAPSEFGLGPLADGKVDILGLKIPVWKACEQSGLECARFCCGGFMNYIAIGDERLDSPEKKHAMLHGLNDGAMIWDIKNHRAELPTKENGKCAQLTMTDIADVGRFVAAACELPLCTWKPYMGMAGDTLGVDTIAHKLGQTIGTPFSISNVKASHLEERVAGIHGMGTSREEIWTKMLSQMELIMIEEKEGYAIQEPYLNKVCPHVKPSTVEDYLFRLNQTATK